MMTSSKASVCFLPFSKGRNDGGSPWDDTMSEEGSVGIHSNLLMRRECPVWSLGLGSGRWVGRFRGKPRARAGTPIGLGSSRFKKYRG